MTKTEARRLAAKHLARAGFFAPTTVDLWQHCPLCPERISAERLPFDHTTKTLASAIADHLIEEH